MSYTPQENEHRCRRRRWKIRYVLSLPCEKVLCQKCERAYFSFLPNHMHSPSITSWSSVSKRVGSMSIWRNGARRASMKFVVRSHSKSQLGQALCLASCPHSPGGGGGFGGGGGVGWGVGGVMVHHCRLSPPPTPTRALLVPLLKSRHASCLDIVVTSNPWQVLSFSHAAAQVFLLLSAVVRISVSTVPCCCSPWPVRHSTPRTCGAG